MSIDINADLCCGDSFCVQVCPTRCITMENQKAKKAKTARFTCLSCGQCIAVCPKDAISSTTDSSEINEAVPPKFSIDKDDFATLVKTRRSIRNYKEKSVPIEVLEEALNVARFAPTAKNGQHTEWVIVNSTQKIRELAGIVIDYMRTVPSLKRIVQNFDEGGDPIFRNAPSLIFAHCPTEIGQNYGEIDCTIATTYLELFLPSLGLGSCWAGFAISISKIYPQVNEFLNLPKENTIYTGLMLGYPSIKYKKIPTRKKLSLQIIE